MVDIFSQGIFFICLIVLISFAAALIEQVLQEATQTKRKKLLVKLMEDQRKREQYLRQD